MRAQYGEVKIKDKVQAKIIQKIIKSACTFLKNLTCFQD